jgi:hypothetical protein
MASLGTVKTAVKRPAEPRLPVKGKARIFDYSKFKLAIHDVNEFIRFVESYPDQTGLMAYFYRLVPKIDLSMVGQRETNIFETSQIEQMMPGFIENKFGRGKYMVKLTDANKPQNERERARSWYKLEDSEKPPVYDIRTLRLADPDNLDEVARQIQMGNLVRDAAGAPRVRTSQDGFPVTPNDSNEPPSKELLSKDALGQILVKMIDRAQVSPFEMLKQSVEIGKLMTPAQPALSVETVIEQVITRLHGSAPRGDSFDSALKTYERMEQVFMRIRGPEPAVVTGDNPSSWAAILPGMLDRAEKMIPMIFMGIERLRSRPGRAGNPQQQRGATAMPNMAERIAEVMMIGLQKMQEGVSGFDFAAWVCNWHEGGIEIYRFLAPRGAVGVLGFAAMNPQAAPFLSDPQTREKVETFLNDFFTYDPDAGEAEEVLPAAS